tara:strand:+ start:595 stop:1386 length:792 start_codon:yes stop_codon:yes gene_type:complete
MFINKKYNNLKKVAAENRSNYLNAKPFPNIVFDDFFNEETLEKILNDFPKNIKDIGNEFNNKAEKKLSLNTADKFSESTNNFINYLNSEPFVKFLNTITGINETLITDPYLIGGGLHELKNDGYLNIHADFNQHPKMKLDRRLNILIYLNHDWLDKNGGHLELWDKEMEKCEKKILPIFNRMVIFSTTDYSYHGNPNKVKVDRDYSRKSIALYYYSNGRPASEKSLGLHSTIFRKRPETNDVDGNLVYKKIIGKFYYKSKGKI